MSSHTRSLLWKHGLLILMVGGLCLYGCPFSRLFGLTCPGCGLTRAWLCFFHGQWREAFAYRPLFLLVPPMLLLLIHRRAPPLADKRFLDVFLSAFFLLLAVYHLFRMGAANFY